MGLSLLDDMISRGNRVAQFRKEEVELLLEFARPLYKEPAANALRAAMPDAERGHSRANEQGHQSQRESTGAAYHIVTPSSTNDRDEEGVSNRDPPLDAGHLARTQLDEGLTSSFQLQLQSQSQLQSGHDDELLFDWRDLGLSLNQMLDAADQLYAQDLTDGSDRDGMRAEDLWLWNTDND